MTMAVQPAGGGEPAGPPTGGTLADVIDTILDKGLVIDAFVRVSLVGIEVLTIDARVVVASVETYLQFAEAVNRLDLTRTGEKGLPDLMGDLRGGGARERGEGVLEGVGEKLREVTGVDREEPEEPEEQEERAPRRRRQREEG